MTKSVLLQLNGMVTALDDIVGNLTQKLKDVGIYRNTILIFSSDNGGIIGVGGNEPLKGKLYNTSFIVLILKLCLSALSLLIFKSSYLKT